MDNRDYCKAKLLLVTQGVDVVEDPSMGPIAQWRGDPNKIFINPTRPELDAYSLLHEYGHVLNGYGCCREHDEYKAHGSAVAMAHFLSIDIGKPPIERYAGYSVPDCCPEVGNVLQEKDGTRGGYIVPPGTDSTDGTGSWDGTDGTGYDGTDCDSTDGTGYDGTYDGTDGTCYDGTDSTDGTMG